MDVEPRARPHAGDSDRGELGQAGGLDRGQGAARHQVDPAAVRARLQVRPGNGEGPQDGELRGVDFMQITGGGRVQLLAVRRNRELHRKKDRDGRDQLIAHHDRVRVPAMEFAVSSANIRPLSGSATKRRAPSLLTADPWSDPAWKFYVDQTDRRDTVAVGLDREILPTYFRLGIPEGSAARRIYIASILRHGYVPGLALEISIQPKRIGNRHGQGIDLHQAGRAGVGHVDVRQTPPPRPPAGWCRCR